MLGWMDDEALAPHARRPGGRRTGAASRQEYWVKGETSGHRQWVKEVRLDCDGDTLLVKVDQEGPACHTGDRTCFDADLLPLHGAPMHRAARRTFGPGRRCSALAAAALAAVAGEPPGSRPPIPRATPVPAPPCVDHRRRRRDAARAAR